MNGHDELSLCTCGAYRLPPRPGSARPRHRNIYDQQGTLSEIHRSNGLCVFGGAPLNVVRKVLQYRYGHSGDEDAQPVLDAVAPLIRGEFRADLRAQVEALPPENVYSYRGPVVLRDDVLKLLDGTAVAQDRNPSGDRAE